MSNVNIDMTYDDSEVQKLFAEMLARGRNTETAMKDIGEAMLISTDKRFRSQVDPQGQPWVPLRPRTLKRKRNKKTLTERGYLRGSIAYDASKDRVAWGTNSPYGAIHQHGGEIKKKARNQTLAFNKRGRFLSRAAAGRRKRGAIGVAFTSIGAHTVNIPARPYLGVSREDRVIILRILRRHLSQG